MSRLRLQLGLAVRAAAVRQRRSFKEKYCARLQGDRGQTTAEYALVLLGAAGIALLLLGWATQSGAIGTLFDAVLGGVIGKVK